MTIESPDIGTPRLGGAQGHEYGLFLGASRSGVDGLHALAALRYLPKVDALLQPNTRIPEGRRLRTIISGDLASSHRTLQDLAPGLEPLFVGVQIEEGRESEHLLSDSRVCELMRKHGPVGCRQLATCSWLESVDVPSYYSGCLMQVFGRRVREGRSRPLFVDVPGELVARLPGHIEPVSLNLRESRRRGRRSRSAYGCSAASLLWRARSGLRLIARSSAVCSTNLDVAVAATALGVPALLLDDQSGEPGIRSLLASSEPSVDSVVEFLQRPNSATSQLEANRVPFAALAEHVDSTCRGFTGRFGPVRERHLQGTAGE